jgi:hypothetical protein
MKYILSISPKVKGIFVIYDMFGNLVRTEIINPDVKEIDINLSSFSDGIYIYKISIDDLINDKGKIVLQK